MTGIEEFQTSIFPCQSPSEEMIKYSMYSNRYQPEMKFKRHVPKSIGNIHLSSNLCLLNINDACERIKSTKQYDNSLSPNRPRTSKYDSDASYLTPQKQLENPDLVSVRRLGRLLKMKNRRMPNSDRQFRGSEEHNRIREEKYSRVRKDFLHQEKESRFGGDKENKFPEGLFLPKWSTKDASMLDPSHTHKSKFVLKPRPKRKVAEPLKWNKKIRGDPHDNGCA